MVQSLGQVGQTYKWEREWPSIAMHPAMRVFPPLCLPLHARPLPLQHPAPLHIISLMQVESQQSHLHIRPQAWPWGSRSRLFPLLCLGPCLRHLLPLLQGPHTRGLSFGMISGHSFSPETCSHTLQTPRGTQLSVKTKIEHVV